MSDQNEQGKKKCIFLHITVCLSRDLKMLFFFKEEKGFVQTQNSIPGDLICFRKMQIFNFHKYLNKSVPDAGSRMNILF